MMEKTRPKCPQCGSRKIARILWGRQNISDELQKEIENGEAILGGCMVPKNSMNWHCSECGLEFVKTGFDELVRFNKKQKPDYIKAHIHSFGNQKEIRESQKCGCFHCLKTFDSAEVVEWIERETGANFGDNELAIWLERLDKARPDIVLIERQSPQALRESLEDAGYAVAVIDVLSTHAEGEGFDRYLEIQGENAQALSDAFRRADAGKEMH